MWRGTCHPVAQAKFGSVVLRQGVITIRAATQQASVIVIRPPTALTGSDFFFFFLSLTNPPLGWLEWYSSINLIKPHLSGYNSEGGIQFV